MALLPLPIDPHLPRLAAAVAAGNLVLVAPPGAGKTTRLPPALVAAGVAGASGKVVMLEPRRVAARAAARRIAGEQGWELGGEVGYQVRFERVAGPRTRLLVVTEGVLVRMLQADPFLDGVAVVVFDELHERSLDADLALAMARRTQRQARTDLRLVAMSATLEAGPVAEYLDAAVERVEGRAYPVAVSYLERSDTRRLPALAAWGARQALAQTDGGVLVFLPGAGEIERTAELLGEGLRGDAATAAVPVLPLHGSLADGAQDAALRPEPRRRIVLATNLAETSLTVPGVGAVVDTGFARVLRFDAGAALDRLELARISASSAEQRAGRAGREGPGSCLRLWTAAEQRALQPREAPEVQRVDLAGAVLQLRAWGESDVAAFPWLEPPPADALVRAEGLLRDLGAVDGGRLTADGEAMAALPLHPRLARLVLDGHRRGWLDGAALLAALLAERDPFRRPPRPRDGEATPVPPCDSDALARVELLRAAARGGGTRDTAYGTIAAGAARRLLQAAEQVAAFLRGETSRSLRRSAPRDDIRSSSRAQRSDLDARAAPAPAAARAAHDTEAEALGRALLAAFPDRLARRRAAGDARGLMVGGRGVRLGPESGVQRAELFLCLDLDAGRRGERAEARVRVASAVAADWLPATDLLDDAEVRYDAARDRVVARRRSRYRDLVVAEAEVPVRDEAAAAAALADAAASDLHAALGLDDDDVAGFLSRVRFLREWRPELALPTFDEPQLAALLPALAAGRRSLAELRRAPVLESLRGMVTPAQLAALEREAPERLAVPSGSRIRLIYEQGRPPVLAARIQELFGLAETPRLAGGRVSVLVHLLAPNGRPQQVTDDLASFWRTTYPQVRKELRARYPRHAWPEDPTTAFAERRPQRRR
ncbi:MAG TPA: ATP-dependent helicase C-terminal domain-containing protein [Thermoanaerobaculia bacterium]|nr:ATP-dependent helicase C-terminal domain-containing protein [Thermoanaerobaculia bacterium]